MRRRRGFTRAALAPRNPQNSSNRRSNAAVGSDACRRLRARALGRLDVVERNSTFIHPRSSRWPNAIDSGAPFQARQCGSEMRAGHPPQLISRYAACSST